MTTNKSNNIINFCLLAVGSVLFLFPFVWLVMTSLKPIEQTMVVPPQWIPKAYYASIDGDKMRVRVEPKPLTQPGVIVQFTEGPQVGEKKFVYETEYKNGTVNLEVQVVDRIFMRPFKVMVLQKVPAEWIYVEERFDEQVFDRKPQWSYLPKNEIQEKVKFEWINYKKASEAMPFWKYTKNTLIICLLGVIGVVISNALVAYGFARIPWRGRETFFLVTLATMMIPFPVTMIPMYTVFRNLHWVGTFYPLWVPAFLGSAFNIFLLRQFFKTIPKDLTDAARIDGCTEFGIFLRIFVPLSKPALAVVALFHFMYAWNDFMGPLIYLTEEKTFTLALGLYSYNSQHGGTEWHYLMAASTMILLPILLLFFFTQKTFVEGISMSGIKE